MLRYFRKFELDLYSLLPNYLNKKITHITILNSLFEKYYELKFFDIINGY